MQLEAPRIAHAADPHCAACSMKHRAVAVHCAQWNLQLELECKVKSGRRPSPVTASPGPVLSGSGNSNSGYDDAAFCFCHFAVFCVLQVAHSKKHKPAQAQWQQEQRPRGREGDCAV